MRDLIVSVGTSLLSNWRRDTDRRELPEPDSLLAWANLQTPEKASAETHTLLRLPLQQNDRIFLLHSSTPDGSLCAQVLQRYFARQCRACETREIKYLSYHEASFADRGLRELLGETFKIIRTARRAGRKVEICATGGFKPELAYLNLAGLLAECPVHYVHETFRNLVTLPPLPVDWITHLDERSIQFLEWLDADFRNIEETEARLKQLPRLRPLVTFETEGCTLSPAGVALLEAWRERNQILPDIPLPDSLLPPEDKIQLSVQEHHRPRGTTELVHRISQLPFVKSIRYRDTLPVTKAETAVLDASSGTLRVRHSDAQAGIELLVETTAAGEATTRQAAQLVHDCLQN